LHTERKGGFVYGYPHGETFDFIRAEKDGFSRRNIMLRPAEVPRWEDGKCGRMHSLPKLSIAIRVRGIRK